VNPHEVLGVRPGAGPDEVRRAWRRKVLTAHPDRGGDERVFAEVTAAYRSLIGDAPPRAASGVPVVFFRSRGPAARAARWWRRRRRGRSFPRVV
jgi:hypothetical protein